jgi:hypothetical protein
MHLSDDCIANESVRVVAYVNETEIRWTFVIEWSPPNALPFSGVGATKPEPRLYADVPAATTSVCIGLLDSDPDLMSVPNRRTQFRDTIG